MKFLQRFFAAPKVVAPSIDWSRLERIEGDSTRLITKEMKAFGVRELEIVDIPRQVEAVAADLLLRLAEQASSEKPQRDGDPIGGAFIDDAQAAMHIATLRIASRSSAPA